MYLLSKEQDQTTTMKIGINASFFRKKDSGTGQVTANFLDALLDSIEKGIDGFAEHEYVLYFEEDPMINMPEKVEERIFSPPYRRDDLIRKLWWEKRLLPKKVAQDGCDVFLSLYQSPTILRKTKHVMVVHDVVWKRFGEYLNNSRKKTYYWQVDRGIKRADHIVTVSEFSKQDLKKYFKFEDDNITVANIDCDKIFKNEYTDEYVSEVLEKYQLKGNYIFYMGGFDKRKNVDGLINAYGMLWRDFNKEIEIPKLVLAGEFHPHLVPLVTDISARVKEINVKYGVPEENIQNIGFALQEHLPALYRGASLFCYPSLHEGFGLPVLEAMNSGCPVVTSKTSSIPEVVGKNGAIMIDPENKREISEAMRELLTNENKRSQLIENGKAQAKKFSWEKFINKIFSAINEVAQ